MSRLRRVRTNGDSVIEYTLERSKRRKKTVQISVSKGVVVVAAPLTTPNREIQAIVEKRSDWILERLQVGTNEATCLRYATGDPIPFLGQTLILAVSKSDVRRPAAHLEGKQLSVVVPFGLSEEEARCATHSALVSWYRYQAAELLNDSVSRWLPEMGRTEMPRILIREQKTRWGSCSADGTLRFSWRLAMVERDLIDSVAVHELAHLDVMNHSSDFWDIVLCAMPDARERRKRLAEVGRVLPL